MREIVMGVAVKGRNPETLRLTLELIFGNRGPKAWTEKNNSLILFDHCFGETTRFPTEMTIDALFPMVTRWLADHEPSESEYDGDGSNYRGFSIEVQEHGPFDQVTIKPHWIYYGK